MLSPPFIENFAVTPVVAWDAYDYGAKEEDKELQVV